MNELPEGKRKRIHEDMVEFCKKKNIPLYSFDDLIEFMDGTGDKVKPWPTLNSLIEWSLKNESLKNLCITVTEEMIEREAKKRGELKLLQVLKEKHKDLYKCKIILHLIQEKNKSNKDKQNE